MNTKLYQKYVFSSKRLALIYNNISVLYERQCASAFIIRNHNLYLFVNPL